MKKIIIILQLAILGLSCFSQSPPAFKYQAIARDNQGNPIINQVLSVRVSILADSLSGVAIYTETHQPVTNLFGLFTLEVGKGVEVNGDFASISWGGISCFLQIEMDTSGGTNYQLMGTSQLLSVPYALESDHSSSLTLENENGNTYEVSIDSLGNMITNLVWECGDPFPDIRNGKIYPTIQIGEQCWMTENLNVGTRINASNPQIDNEVIEKYCYNNLESNCLLYGGLYRWDEMMNYNTLQGKQGICPEGWHIPTDGEWKILEGNVDSLYFVGDPIWNSTGWRGYDAGGNLKETGTQHWLPPNSGATNSSGFIGLPNGRTSVVGGFYYINYFSYLMSSTEYNGSSSWIRHLGYGGRQVSRTTGEKEIGYGVRCLSGEQCLPIPTQADAGPNQQNWDISYSYLDANTPEHGIGRWSFVDSTNLWGWYIEDPTDPNSYIWGQDVNVFRWTISNECGSTSDDVVIEFFFWDK